MPESTIYRISSVDIVQINWTLAKIADRLDIIEGLRGDLPPTFWAGLSSEGEIKYTDSNGTVLHSFGGI